MADQYETAVQLSERLSLSIAEAAAAVGVSERLMRTLMPKSRIVALAIGLLFQSRYWPNGSENKPRKTKMSSERP